MQFKHALLIGGLSAGFIMSASAHEITFAIGGLSSTLNSQQQYIDTTPGTGIDSRDSGSNTILGGEAALAYVWNVNSGFDIGFEFFYSYTGNNLDVYASSGALNTVNNVWGFRGLPGFHITNNTKIYVNLGYAIVDQKLDISGVDPSGHVPGFSSTSATSGSFDGGFQYGAGIETMIYNTIGIRLAYTAEESSALTLKSDNGAQKFEATPTVYSFFFGATYHFQF